MGLAESAVASGRGGGEGVSLKGSAGDGKALLTRAVGIGQALEAP